MPTVARGVAAAALLASLWVGALAVQRQWPAAPAPPPIWCASVVELGTADGRGRLACADSLPLGACAGVQAGDRVEMDPAGRPPRCHVESHGMRAAWRLMRGFPIDVNRASAQELQLLDGVGPKTAAAIVAYRQKVGRVRELDELRRVRGIGSKTVAQLRGLLSADLDGAGASALPGRAAPEGCAVLPQQSIGERCNVDG